MNKVLRFFALLLGSSAFMSNYPSYAAKKYESKSRRTDSVSDIRKRKKDARKGKSTALVSSEKNGSENSKVKSFATKSAATSKGNGNKFSPLWFLTGGGSGTAVAGLASWGGRSYMIGISTRSWSISLIRQVEMMSSLTSYGMRSYLWKLHLVLFHLTRVRLK